MEIEDLEPRNKKPHLKNLEEMSVEGLYDYITDLEREIDRVRATIKEKQKARAAADSIFKSS